MTILWVEVRDYNLKISIYTTVTLTRQLYVYLMVNDRYEGNREVILIGNNVLAYTRCLVMRIYSIESAGFKYFRINFFFFII